MFLRIQRNFIAVCLLTNIACARIIDLQTEQVDRDNYDYVIIGGGTAGMVLAGRLSEDPSITVAVLEAGGSGIGNINITCPGLVFDALASDVNWNFSTVPQQFAANTTVSWPRGKVLGGSTAINGHMLTRGQKAEYDAFEQLGNPGWTWDSLFHYGKKSENLHIPTKEEIKEFGYKFVVDDFGSGGPLDITFANWYPPFFQKGYFPSAELLGFEVIPSGGGGHIDGLQFIPTYVNTNAHRTTAFTAYYDDTRNNLDLYTHAHVAKIQFSKGDKLTATGVEFLYPNGTIGSLTVSKEAIISAGTVQTPQVLELSGIGDPDVLGPLGIPVKYANKGVGANLQDHAITSTTWSTKPEYYDQSLVSLTNETARAIAFDLWQNNATGLLAASMARIQFSSLEEIIRSPSDLATAHSLLATKPAGISQPQFDIIKRFILGGNPIIEYVPIPINQGNATLLPGLGYGLIQSCVCHPLSRGSVHVVSTNPLDPPAIDPRYLEAEFDLWLLAKTTELLRSIFFQEPFQEVLLNESVPGVAVQTFDDYVGFTQRAVDSECHPIGTAALLPEVDGGVVSPEALVYGTTNVRIADASVIPLHISGHTTNIVYSLAEKIADLVRST